MPGFQIGIRLAAESKAAFEEYASSWGLDASSLVKLLILREYRLRRLAGPSVNNRDGKATKTLPKITAHMAARADVEMFDRHAKANGFTRNSAGLWLIRMEMEERWIDRMLSQP